MDVSTIFSYIRKISNSSYYQSIYSLDNKNLGIHLFYNNVDLSLIQIMFLNYLGFYSNLHMDVYLGEVDERVFENEIYEDSYSFYKNKMRKEEKDKNKIRQPKEKQEAVSSQWIFKPPKKV